MSKKQQLEKAFDSATMTGKLVDLNEEQATEFLSLIEDESAFLKKIRKHVTKKPTGTIGKITLDGNFLKPWAYNAQLGTDKEFGSATVEYATKLVRGQFMIYDSEIRNNIEGEGLETTMLGLVASKVANDYEEMALYGRKRANPVSVREMIDGILWRAEENGTVVDANSASFSDRYVDRSKFRTLLKNMDPKFRKNAEFFVSPDVMMDYEDLYSTVADYRVRQELQARIAKKPTTECNLLLDDSSVLVSGGISTTVDTATGGSNVAGQKIVTVASATGIVAGKVLDIQFGTDEVQRMTVASVASTQITMTENLAYDLSVGDTVKEVTRDGADIIASDPMNIVWVQQTGRGSMTFEAERIAGVGYRRHYVGNVDLIVVHNEKLGLLKNMEIK